MFSKRCFGETQYTVHSGKSSGTPVSDGNSFDFTECLLIIDIGDAFVRHVADKFRDIDTLPTGNVQAQEPFIVHGASIVEVEETYSLEGLPFDQRRRMVEGGHVAVDPASIVWLASVTERRFACLVKYKIAEDEVCIRCVHRIHGDCQLTGRQPVISIKELNGVAPRQCHTLVKRIADPAIRLADPDVVRTHAGSKHVLSAVRRAAVHNDMFEILEVLLLNAIDRPLDGLSGIEDDRDNRDPGSVESGSASAIRPERPRAQVLVIFQCRRVASHG